MSFTNAITTGTWTPVVTGGANVNKGHTYSLQIGNWIKIGKTVFIQGQAIVSSLGTIDGSTVSLGGLPFPIKADVNYRPVVSIRPTDLTFTGIPGGTGVQNASYIAINATASGGVTTNLIDSALAGTCSISVFTMYETD